MASGLLALAFVWAPSSVAETASETLSQSPIYDPQLPASSPLINTNATVEIEPFSRLFLTRANLETWASETLGAAEARGQFVGSGIAIFRPEGLVLSKGYGRSDFEKPDPVHPSITYLPAARFGNLLVAEQLVELEAMGRLDLGGRAHDYLTRVSLPPDYRHLTIRDLFGVKTGLTSSVRGTHLVRSRNPSHDLGHVKSMVKRSVLEQPESRSYSPLASALASLVAEDVSGHETEAGLGGLLLEGGSITAWFNSAGSQLPKYTSFHHTISRFGEIDRNPLHVAAPGFVASQGLYMTLDDMAQILANHLKALIEKSPVAEKIVGLAFQQKMIEGAEAELTDPVLMLELKGGVSTSTIHAVLIPELEIGLLAVVNSSSRSPDFAPGGGRTRSLPPLVASDIVESFLQEFVSPGEPGTGGSKNDPSLADGLFKTASHQLIGSDRIVELLSPLRRTSSVTGLMALFLFSLVLQFALMAAARWPAATGGQRVSKWLGMASVVSMTAALSFPLALLVFGHSRTLVDPIYRLSQWAFPVAGLLAVATLAACLIGWKESYWGEEGVGVRRRLCFTVGSAGVLGLTVVAWQLNLMVPAF